MTVVGRLGRKGANGGWLDCAMRQNWNVGMGECGNGERWGKRADGNE
ncbi:hypothetical protein [Bartonella sp. TT119HLJHH]